MTPYDHADWKVNRVMAQHLRYDHGWGWKRIAKRLNLPLARVREMVPTEGER